MRICVFCGSKTGARPEYVEAARNVGRLLAERGIDVVYGGASVGLMGEVADAALAAGGEVIGVIPRGLFGREVAHRGLTELRIVADMHERKATMAQLSDAFIALPGGSGTLEELFEVWTWGQIGVHEKPCGLLDVDGYFGQLNGFVEHMVVEQFLKPEHRRMLTAHSDVDELLREFESYQPPRKREYPPSKGESIDTLAWLHIRDRRLLMVRTRGKQLFYLAGGKREPGESDVRALTREINEELTVNLRPETFTFVRAITAVADGFDNFYSGRQVNMVCYSAEYDGDLAAAAEIEELTWATTADSHRCPPAGQQVLGYLHSMGAID
jgi:uncharacterized protein (TIGR00730 family)